MTTYQELVAQKAELDKQAAELAVKLESAKAEQKAEAIAHVRQVMCAMDVTLADLAPPRTKSAHTAKAPREARTSVNPLTGRKVPIKYRGVDDEGKPAAWSGRGLQPRWLRDAIAAGSKLESFEVAE